MRHEFSDRTKRTLAARVGWRCSNPDCRAATTGPTKDKNRASNVGVAAHINAAAPMGPRYEPRQLRVERQAIANGIWLCQTCAKIVDDDPDRYDTPTLRYWRQDAELLADWEKGRALDRDDAVRFAAIQIDPGCLWWPAHRLYKVWMRKGARADFGFHQVPKTSWSELGISPRSHSLDPILDFTVVNDGGVVTIVSAIGFEPIDVWSALKGLPVAYKVPPVDSYRLSVQPVKLGRAQVLELPDPVAISTAGAGRFKLCLEGYANALGGNESLIRIQVTANTAIWKSRLIYMGTY